MWSSQQQQQQQEDADDGSSGGGRDSSSPSTKPEEGMISASSTESGGLDSHKGSTSPSISSSPLNLPHWQYSRVSTLKTLGDLITLLALQICVIDLLLVFLVTG